MDWRKRVQGRPRFTSTSGQNGPGADWSSRGGRRGGKIRSRRLPKKTRGQEGGSTSRRGTGSGCGILTGEWTADILSIVDAGKGVGIAGRTLRAGFRN